MKNYGRETFEASRPNISALGGIDFCLMHLYSDRTKNPTDEIVSGLNFEELIGALLVARDKVEACDKLEVSDDE